MKYNISICIFLITFSCMSMENIHDKKFKEITIIQEPIGVRYLTKNHAIIFGKNGCSIIDVVANKEIKKIDNDNYTSTNFSHISLRPDKKKIAVSNKKNIKIYDVATGNQEWSTVRANNIYGVVFSSLDTTIFLMTCAYDYKNTITKHNYVTNEQCEIYHDSYVYPSIALHPTQNSMCVGNTNHDMFLYQLDNLQLAEKKDQLKNIIAQSYQYSHDGSFILAYGLRDLYITDANLKNFSSYCILGSNESDLHGFILNATSTMLIILLSIQEGSDSYYAVRYWDITTQRCIKTVKIEKKNLRFIYSIYKRFSLSDDETELMIVLNNKCIIVPVPFEVNKKSIFLSWILKNYQKNNPEIPNEIVQYIFSAVRDITECV